jgi:hypothetical protein
MRRHLRAPGAALGVLLLALLLAAALPSVALAGPEDDCDFPVVKETTEVDFDCAGDLEDITGVRDDGSDEDLPEDTGEADPIAIRRCSAVAATGTIRADNVDCETARSLAGRAGKRRRFTALGFTCTASGRKWHCFRPSSGPRPGEDTEENIPNDDDADDGGDGEEAGYVVFTRRSRR